MSSFPGAVALDGAELSAERRRRFLRRLRLLPLLALALPAGWVGARVMSGNFAVVEPGEVYRSGQMDAKALAAVVRERGIKTVLNLRGAHPEAAWYRAERNAVLSQGATQVDIALSSREWMSRVQAAALLDAIDGAERPLLIHCFNGSERTGLVSAYAELLRPDRTLADAEGQFSRRYLFVRMGGGVVMPRHLEAYEAWLASQGLAHEPGRFRSWIAEGFRPGKPSREDWPYDPYPLVVITHPPGSIRR